MLIFSKDIGQRDHIHALEDKLPNLKGYMEYQRKLFPYTIVRAGLDLAYKEVDDILSFIDNDYRPPTDSNRQEYPLGCRSVVPTKISLVFCIFKNGGYALHPGNPS